MQAEIELRVGKAVMRLVQGYCRTDDLSTGYFRKEVDELSQKSAAT